MCCSPAALREQIGGDFETQGCSSASNILLIKFCGFNHDLHLRKGGQGQKWSRDEEKVLCAQPKTLSESKVSDFS